MSEFTFDRHRRLRSSVSMRALVQETHLRATDFIYPIFVIEGEDIRNEVSSMPGVFQVSFDHLLKEVEEAYQLGIRSLILFGVVEEKDEIGSEAFHDHGIIQKPQES